MQKGMMSNYKAKHTCISNYLFKIIKMVSYLWGLKRTELKCWRKVGCKSESDRSLIILTFTTLLGREVKIA